MAEVFEAIVMYQRDHKEKDLMVKMLTKTAQDTACLHILSPCLM